MTTSIRLRFAPSPTGFMHLGNVRAALMNYLFAQQKKGTFILRIEDTDANRNIDPCGTKIMQDLSWLGLHYDEGPIVGGSYAPYYQSERREIYKKYLQELIDQKKIYRCFCSPEELEKRRQRQLSLKQPPRYDRTCLKLSEQEIAQKLQDTTPFIWRFMLDQNATVSFYDLAHKTMHFELKHFSDIPLTRQDGSFTFLFANFIDDYVMQISHVFRGEDHLTNTAVQIALYQVFNAPIPLFWHLPIIGNKEGKKLSKRDFGFSLTDLQQAGFLPEALCNYLAIIGASFEHEIMSKEQLAHIFNFNALSSTGQIRYDLEKLRWVNHQWIMRYDSKKLALLCKPFLEHAYTQAKDLTLESLTSIIAPIQKEIITLNDCVELLAFYFKPQEISQEQLDKHHRHDYQKVLHIIIDKIQDKLDNPEAVYTSIQEICKTQGIALKPIFTLLRLVLMGKVQGPGIKELLSILGPVESKARLEQLLV